jgi:hypothetical protein
MAQKLPPFSSFRDTQLWENFIVNKLAPFEQNVAKYFQYWYIESHEGIKAYPSQGLLSTPFDFLPPYTKGMLSPEERINILRVRQYFLELFNHPERIKWLEKVDKAPFIAPPKVSSAVMERVIRNEIALSVGDLGISVQGSQGDRISRTERFAQGPFIKLGRQARSLFVGSAMPDIYGSVSAISTMAKSHCLVGIPRNGPFVDIKRQVDLVHEVWTALKDTKILIGRPKKDQNRLIDLWKHNVMGVLEVEPDAAMKRMEKLYNAGVRVFRVYSPEPGKGALQTVQRIRKMYGKEPEIFVGQVVDVQQAKQLEEAGADGLYIGIGGGGRCITGVRSGSVIDWGLLLWKLRGEINIPVIVEGGASDHIAVTLALGASGIGVSRVVGGGTIESPGGMLYCIDQRGNYFKPYGGEASARTKYLDGKMLPFGIPSFVEGETRSADMLHLPYGVPTIPFNLYSLIEDSILSFVFRGVKSLSELHALDPSPLRQQTSQGDHHQHTH